MLCSDHSAGADWLALGASTGCPSSQFWVDVTVGPQIAGQAARFPDYDLLCRVDGQCACVAECLGYGCPPRPREAYDSNADHTILA